MSLQHLILGVLKYAPMSGYDLNKAFQASVQHFWDTDQSLIYRALHKLYEAGWVDVEVVPQELAPAKKLYRLTDTGRDELLRWLRTPQPVPALHEDWLGQLFFGAELSADELRGLLEARIAEIKAILARYENDAPAAAAHYASAFQAGRDSDFWLLTLDYGIEKLRLDLHWAERALERIAVMTERPDDQS